MAGLKYAAIRAAFEVFALPGVSGLIRRASPARGVIFTLHRVVPEAPARFSPNAILQVTPAFLDHAIGRVRELGLDIVDLDEAVTRLEAPEARPFAVFTFDDGYRDNLVHALPILRRHKAPFTLYIPTSFVDGVGQLWWQVIEDIVARQQAIGFTVEGEKRYLPTVTLAEKRAAYDQIYWYMREAPEVERITLLHELAESYGVDLDAHCRSLIMDWSELQAFADEPLCTIGAHTVHHYELAKLSEADARNEIEQSARILEAQLGRRPAHLSYPLGGPKSAGPREYDIAGSLGFRTAVTTKPGGLTPANRGTLMSLPRISLNGLFQARRYVDVFATGTIFNMLGRIGG